MSVTLIAVLAALAANLAAIAVLSPDPHIWTGLTGEALGLLPAALMVATWPLAFLALPVWHALGVAYATSLVTASVLMLTAEIYDFEGEEPTTLRVRVGFVLGSPVMIPVVIVVDLVRMTRRAWPTAQRAKAAHRA